jgi:hypothetical protein
MPEVSNRRTTGCIGFSEQTVEEEDADCARLMGNMGKSSVADARRFTQQ